MYTNKCIYCGIEVPEGEIVCPVCYYKLENGQMVGANKCKL